MSKIIIVTKVRTREGLKLVDRLIRSVRAFGGEMSSDPFWVFVVNSEKLVCEELANETTRIIPLDVPDHLLQYDLGD